MIGEHFDDVIKRAIAGGELDYCNAGKLQP